MISLISTARRGETRAKGKNVCQLGNTWTERKRARETERALFFLSVDAWLDYALNLPKYAGFTLANALFIQTDIAASLLK